ncbi:protein of unknown function (plasmid) [Caballeronia sp. S22]
MPPLNYEFDVQKQILKRPAADVTTIVPPNRGLTLERCRFDRHARRHDAKYAHVNCEDGLWALIST